MQEVGLHLTMIWSGTHIQPVHDIMSPWYNLFAREIPLGALDEAEARELIVEPVKDMYLYSDEAIQRLLELTGCEPYRLQRLCHATIIAVLARVRDQQIASPVEVTASDVEAARGVLPPEIDGEPIVR